MTGSLERVSAEDGHEREIAAVREATFPIALRGYEREAVDAYVKRVDRLVRDLEASRSPDAAVRRALDRVGEETSSILQRAQETATEITERSRASADDRIQEAEREARTLTEDAEDRVRELEAHLGEIWARRDRLLDEVRDVAERLLATADDAAERFPAWDDEATPAREREPGWPPAEVSDEPSPLGEAPGLVDRSAEEGTTVTTLDTFGGAGSGDPEPSGDGSAGEEMDFGESPDEALEDAPGLADEDGEDRPA